jgi:serine protease
MKRPVLVTAACASAVLLAALIPEPPALRAGSSLRVARPRRAPAPLPAQREGEVVVQFRRDRSEREIERALRDGGAERARPSSFGPRYLVRLEPGTTVADAVRRYGAMPEVEFAEPNRVARAFQRPGHFVPNDEAYDFQWHLRMLDAERTWGIQKGNAAVVVAVLDSGVAFEDFGPFRRAPDFANTVFVPGHDFVNGDSHPNDDNFHGTTVAAVIAESTNNSQGVAGLAFDTAIMPVKVLDADGNGNFFDIADAIDFAISDDRVKVINLSLGTDTCDCRGQVMSQAVSRAVEAGVTVVASSGNEAESVRCVKFPACLPNVIAVGALDGRKLRAPYSDFGPELDVVAPGGDVARDDNGPDGRPDGDPDGILQETFDPATAFFEGRFDDFGLFYVEGTSFSAPLVSATAALLYRQGITDPAAIQRAIEATAEDLGTPGRDDTYGHGMVRPSVALTGLGFNR